MEGAKEAIWLQSLLEAIKKYHVIITIFVDNESYIKIIKDLIYHAKTKHIETHYHFIRRENYYMRDWCKVCQHKKVSSWHPPKGTRESEVSAFRQKLALCNMAQAKAIDYNPPLLENHCGVPNTFL